MNSRSQFDGGSDLRNATASSPVQRVGSGMGLSNQLGPTAAGGGGDELAWSSISLTSSPSPHSSQAKPLSVGPLHLHWGSIVAMGQGLLGLESTVLFYLGSGWETGCVQCSTLSVYIVKWTLYNHSVWAHCIPRFCPLWAWGYYHFPLLSNTNTNHINFPCRGSISQLRDLYVELGAVISLR